MNTVSFQSTTDLIILLGIAMVVAVFAMNMIANTRRISFVNDNLEHKDSQITQLTSELKTLSEACQSLQKEVDIRDLYNGETDRYLQAINAAKTGLNMEHLMDQFDLIEAEAELIISMHGAEKSETTIRV